MMEAIEILYYSNFHFVMILIMIVNLASEIIFDNLSFSIGSSYICTNRGWIWHDEW